MTGSVLDGYITAASLAYDLGVTERTLREWHTRRLGPPRIVIGRRVFYSRGSVRAWLAAQERAAMEGSE